MLPVLMIIATSAVYARDKFFIFGRVTSVHMTRILSLHNPTVVRNQLVLMMMQKIQFVSCMCVMSHSTSRFFMFYNSIEIQYTCSY